MKKLFLLLLASVLYGCGGSSSDPSGDSSGDTDAILVYIDREGVQCESVGISPEESESTLVSQGIEVIETSCGSLTGVSASAVCGGPTTGILIHEISSQDEVDALALGYVNVANLETENSSGFMLISCDAST